MVSQIKGAIEVPEHLLANAFKQGVGVDGRIADVTERKLIVDPTHDYIKELLKKDDYEIWDIGGSSGIHYFSTEAYKTNSVWRVFELPETYGQYKNKVAERNNLFFEPIVDKIVPKTDLKIILFSQGAIQYFETPLKWLEENTKQANKVILKNVNIANKTFLSCQVGVGLCWFFDETDFFRVFQGKGYQCLTRDEGEVFDSSALPSHIKVYQLKTFRFEK